MKALAIVIGLILVALGIAALAGSIAIAAIKATALIVVGAIVALFGVMRHRTLGTPSGPGGHDLRDMGGL